MSLFSAFVSFSAWFKCLYLFPEGPQGARMMLVWPGSVALSLHIHNPSPPHFLVPVLLLSLSPLPSLPPLSWLLHLLFLRQVITVRACHFCDISYVESISPFLPVGGHGLAQQITHDPPSCRCFDCAEFGYSSYSSTMHAEWCKPPDWS